LPAIVTPHDSDYLGRTNKVYDPLRRVLGAIPGVEIREMSWTREKAHSCGESAGVFAALYPEIVPSLAVRLIEEARTTGAVVLATTCPVTKRALADSRGIEVRDAMELLEKSLRV
jgi:Fe-S oxidoreductase